MVHPRVVVMGTGLLVSIPILLTSHATADTASGSVPRVAVSAKHLQSFTVHGQGARKGARLTSNELRDLKRYSAESGKSLSGLKASTFGQSEFAHAVHVLRLRDRGTFVASGHLKGAGLPPYWIQFTKRPNAASIAPLRKLATDTTVQYDSPISVEQATELSAAILSRLSDEVGVDAGVGGLNEAADGVNVTYSPPAGMDDDALTAAENGVLTEVAADELGGELPAPVVFTRDPALQIGENQTTFQGGRNLVSWGTTGQRCTAGFTAARTDDGLITAGHCVNDLYYSVKGDIPYVKHADAIVKRGIVDLQFHRASDGNSVNKQFRATGRTAADDRTVNSVGDVSNGDTICKWGETTGFDCSKVVQVDKCIDFGDPGGPACGLAVMDDIITAGGDSGGPNFFGNQANGITKGSANGGSVFTMISYAIYLQAHVLHN